MFSAKAKVLLTTEQLYQSQYLLIFNYAYEECKIFAYHVSSVAKVKGRVLVGAQQPGDRRIISLSRSSTQSVAELHWSPVL